MSGYWALYHDELKAMLKEDLGLYELKVYLALADLTRGYQDYRGKPKKKDRVALSQIGDMTSIQTPNVARALKSLEAKGLVTSERISPKRTIRGVVINVVWQDGQDKPIKDNTVSRDTTTVSGEIQTTVSETVSPEIQSVLSVETTRLSPETVTNQSSKQQTTNKPVEGFDTFWSLVPNHKRRGKIGCLQFWTENGLESQADAVIECYSAWVESTEWQDGERAQFIPSPLNWLRDSMPDFDSSPAELYLGPKTWDLSVIEPEIRRAQTAKGYDDWIAMAQEHCPEDVAILLERYPRPEVA